MQLEAIKVFCDLAGMRSFSKAAAANGRSQPAVTRIVQELEDRLQGKLIDRSHRPLQLTALGQAYYEGCKRLLEQYLELEASLLSAPPQLAVTVRVAAIYSVGLGDMGHYVNGFEADHPHARVRVDYLHPAQVYEHVRAGTADFGLVSFPRPCRDLAQLCWRDEEMVVACAASHPLAKRDTVRPEQLNEQKYVAFESGLDIRREVDQYLTQHGVAVNIVHEFDTIENIKQGIIEGGTGVALLPEPTIRKEVQAGTLRALRLEGDRLVRPLAIIHRRRTPPGSAAQDFITLLRGGAPFLLVEADETPHANGVPHEGNGAGHSSPRPVRSRKKRTQS